MRVTEIFELISYRGTETEGTESLGNWGVGLH